MSRVRLGRMHARPASLQSLPGTATARDPGAAGDPQPCKGLRGRRFDMQKRHGSADTRAAAQFIRRLPFFLAARADLEITFPSAC